MKKLVVVALVSALAGLGVVAAAPGAQAYPDPAVSVSVDHQKVVGGNPVTATATSSVPCAWRVSFLGQSRSGVGTSFRATFDTPKVRHAESRDLTVTCTYASGSGTSTVTRTVPITIVPRRDQVSAPGGPGTGNGSGSGSSNGSGNGSGSAAAPASGSSSAPSLGGLLPGTGGPDAAYLLGGLVLLVLGAGALVVNRRRASRP